MTDETATPTEPSPAEVEDTGPRFLRGVHDDEPAEEAPKKRRSRRKPVDPDAPAKPKYKRPGIGNYPVQLVVMESQEVADLIRDLADREGLHKTEVIRAFIHAGIRKAGHGRVLKVDKRERPIGELSPEGK